jgi:hypothetical protein
MKHINSVAFLYTNSKSAEIEIKKALVFPIVTKVRNKLKQ